MARRCEICGKGTMAGNVVTRKGQPKKRVFRPNIITVKTMVNGTPTTVKVCARCLRTGKIQKVI